jgi:hypothetical protein
VEAAEAAAEEEVEAAEEGVEAVVGEVVVARVVVNLMAPAVSIRQRRCCAGCLVETAHPHRIVRLIRNNDSIRTMA